MRITHLARPVAIGLLALTLVACSAGASPSPSPSPSPTPDGPIGSGPPVDGPPLAGAKVVVPRPGQLDVHEVSADRLAAQVDGRRVVVSVDWWSGVEPCTILDTILVERGERSFTVTLREGRGPDDVACVAIGELHRAFVDLGDLEPGTYTVRDGTGGAPDLEVVVG